MFYSSEIFSQIVMNMDILLIGPIAVLFYRGFIYRGFIYCNQWFRKLYTPTTFVLQEFQALIIFFWLNYIS